MNSFNRVNFRAASYRVATLLTGLALVYGPGAWAFAISFLASQYTASNFATIGVNTNAIALDAGLNLYVQDQSASGADFSILEFTAASGYSSSSVFSSYPRDSSTHLNGLDFDPSGTLFSSENDAGGNAGTIRNANTGAQTKQLANFRPTGIDAPGGDVIYFSGRRESQGNFGNIYRLTISTGVVDTVISSIVSTGVALNDTGDIFVSTKQTAQPGGYLPNSIYRFDFLGGGAYSTGSLVATFDENVGELAFDGAGRLYAMENNPDNSPGTTSIIQLTVVPAPATAALFLLGLAGIARFRPRAAT